MKKFAWVLLLIGTLFAGMIVSSIDFKNGGDWPGAYGAASASGVGAIAPRLEVPFLRGDRESFSWTHGELGQVSPCTVTFVVDATDSAVGELFAPHAAELVALAPDAVHVVWASEQGDDTWLPADAPGSVVQMDASMRERFGIQRVPTALLVNGRGAIIQRGFPTEVDEASIREAHSDSRAWSRGGRHSLNQIEPILYRDGEDEKVAVRVIPESMSEFVSSRTRHREALTSVSVSITQRSLPEMVNSLKRREGEVRVPPEFEGTMLKVDAWLSGVTIGPNSALGFARELGYDALLEALELQEVEGAEVDGYALRLNGDFRGKRTVEELGSSEIDFNSVSANSITLDTLALGLGYQLDGPVVVDISEDVGAFDVEIEWIGGDVSSLSEALTEALGVSLEPARVPSDAIVLEAR